MAASPAAPVRIGRVSLPTGRPGRLLAAGLLLLLLVAGWELVGSPLCDWYDGRAEALAGRQALSVRMQALAARLPALRRAAEAGAGRSGPGVLIEGGSDAIAGAALQGQVQQMAATLGASLSSSETLPGAAAGPSGSGYRRVAVRISVTAPFEVMVRLVAAIERATPVMLIDDFELHGSRIQLMQNAPLEASLTVLSFRRGEATGPGGGSDTAEPGASP